MALLVEIIEGTMDSEDAEVNLEQLVVRVASSFRENVF